MDGSGAYGTDREHAGVWLSSVPLDENEGACGDALLTIEIVFEDVDSLKRFEWVDPDHRAGYREGLIPAKWVNIRAVIMGVELREPSSDFAISGVGMADNRTLSDMIERTHSL